MRLVCSLLVLIAIGATASASTTYNLTNDFSNANNPNGPWSFRQGSVIDTHFTANSGNALDAAAGNGYWGIDASYVSSVIKTTTNGSNASGYSNNDFLAGDVISHSTNPGAGGPMNIDWIAPGPGTITFSGSVWYAHTPVIRSNDFTLTLNNGAALASGTVAPGVTRSSAITFASSATLNVSAGDILDLQLTPTAGQQNGSLSGVTFNVVFTPEPATLGLLAAIPLTLIRRRRAA